MGALAESNFLQALGWAVLNSLWQMALLWVAYQLISGLLVSSPASRNLLATLLLGAGFFWFLYSFISLLQFNEPASAPGLGPWVITEQVNDFFYQALPVASLVYLSFLILPCLQFIRNYRYVRVIRRQGLHRAGADWRLFVNKVSDRMGIRKNVQIWLSDFVSSPVTIGYLKPIILLPVAALNHLGTAQAEAILLHELAHIRRSDYLINLTVRVVQALLYFNPFVKAFARIIEIEREKTCDDLVLQFHYEPHGYASALLALEKESRRLQLLTIPAVSERKSELLLRVESIMGTRRKDKFSMSHVSRLASGIACGLLFILIVMLSHPLPVQAFKARLAGYFSPYLVYPATGRTGLAGSELSDGIITNSPAPDRVAATSVTPSQPVDNQLVASEKVEIPDESNPAVVFASSVDQPAPVLTESESKQVRIAIETSRKVLEEIKWKDMDQAIADAMTEAQKEIARQALQQKLAQVNWTQMENKLKTSYDQINWTEINKNLSNAVIQIRYDSIQQVYARALNGLAELEKELDRTGLTGIPDTDITVPAIKRKQGELKKATADLRRIKARKIIQL